MYEGERFAKCAKLNYECLEYYTECRSLILLVYKERASCSPEKHCAAVFVGSGSLIYEQTNQELAGAVI